MIVKFSPPLIFCLPQNIHLNMSYLLSCTLIVFCTFSPSLALTLSLLENVHSNANCKTVFAHFVCFLDREIEMTMIEALTRATEATVLMKLLIEINSY